MNYFINKYMNQLNHIEHKLQRYPDVGPNPNPDRMNIDHLMLLEEQKKLEDRINREARAYGVQNPLEPRTQYEKKLNHNQSLRVDNSQPNNDTPNDKVSPDERRRACEALKPNGCGPKGEWISGYIPNKPEGFDFTAACNNHDRNYGTLGVSFSEANNQFYIDMMKAVNAVAQPGTRIYKGGENLAKLYFDKVVEHGLPAYKEAQRNAYICKYGKKPD